ncbi:MAG TPA: ECF-type sigma factor [Bryobacteraceae bacterium]|nr:ECF-type sigma factor [Bryobacteraceae bacterium]
MEITDLLRRAHDGDAEALHTVVPLVYDELKRLASSHLRREHSPQSLETTVLVHEAFLRLAGSRLPDCENRSHFFGIAARVMRQVLVDSARSRRAAKRGDGVEAAALITLPELGATPDDEFLALNEALERLAMESPLKGQLIELYYFAGLTAEESGEAVSLPVHTVRRELRLARAWLRNELQ